MSGKVNVSDTTYNIGSGKALVDGTKYNISQGKTTIGGTVYDIFPNSFKAGWATELPWDPTIWIVPISGKYKLIGTGQGAGWYNEQSSVPGIQIPQGGASGGCGSVEFDLLKGQKITVKATDNTPSRTGRLLGQHTGIYIDNRLAIRFCGGSGANAVVQLNSSGYGALVTVAVTKIENVSGKNLNQVNTASASKIKTIAPSKFNTDYRTPAGNLRSYGDGIESEKDTKLVPAKCYIELISVAK